MRRFLSFLFATRLIQTVRSSSVVDESSPIPHDVTFTLVDNRRVGYSIRVQRCDNNRRGVFGFTVEDPENVVIQDHESAAAPDMIDLLTASEDRIPFGSFSAEGPSRIWIQRNRHDFQDYQRSFGTISLQHGSQFARRFRNFLIQPIEQGGLVMGMDSMGINYRVGPSRSGHGFKMVANIADPSVYAFENAIEYVPAAPGNTPAMNARVTLVSGDSSSTSSSVESAQPSLIETGVEVYEFGIGTVSVPSAVRNALNTEIERISGMTWREFQSSPACENLIDRLPILKFTLVDPNNSNADLVDIQLNPRDYIVLNGEYGRCSIEVTGYGATPQIFGVAILKNVGVLVDFENRQFGIFEHL